MVSVSMPAKTLPKNLRIGTCSWNYDSWVGLIYKKSYQKSVDYLREYAESFLTAEIDSWFYKIPSKQEVVAYKNAVPPDLRFTCKVPRSITRTHIRSKMSKAPLAKNDDFLSVDAFTYFLRAIDPMLGYMDGIIFEFEYLNKNKMASAQEFQNLFTDFLRKTPSGLPYAVEIRNGNYLSEGYFAWLGENNLIPVFPEKIFMPHVYDVYEKHHTHIRGNTIIRLLGGDRTEMEKKTGSVWNTIVDEKLDLRDIVNMTVKLLSKGVVTVNINNHYEGSAPLTMQRFIGFL